MIFDWHHNGKDLRGMPHCRGHQRFDLGCQDCWAVIVRSMPTRRNPRGRTFPRSYRESGSSPGQCCLCGYRIENQRKGQRWHPGCVGLWDVMCGQTLSLRHLCVALGPQRCAVCGMDVVIRRGHPEVGHADHIVPLWKADRSDPGHWRLWVPPNIQLLCSACHAQKTKAEAAERAVWKRTHF